MTAYKMEFENKWTPRLQNAVNTAHNRIKSLIGTHKGAEKLEEGAGGDMTTTLDKTAEKAIFSVIESYGEDAIIISEERGTYFYDSRQKERIYDYDEKGKETNNYFIIDPLDGSSNASRGLPFSSISIAYADGPTFADIKVGCVINLATRDIYLSEKGKGAFLNSQPIQCSEVKELGKAMVAVAFKSNKLSKTLERVQMEFLKSVGKIRILGSCALECCLIAQGALDVYVDLRETIRTVDFAAGYLILKEAGGFFNDGDFNPIDSQSIFLDNRFSIILGNESLKLEVKKYYG